MTTAFIGHYDGKVIVPDEPVELPISEKLRFVQEEEGLTIAERLERLRESSGQFTGPAIPAEALRRENLYEDRV